VSTFKEVVLAALVPPERPMRTESLYEGLDELKESMATNGLQQPIGVKDLGEGKARIIWGMRRALAARELGWLTISAYVYGEGEGDETLLMAHENFHRTQLNPIEEGEFYARLIAEHDISVAEAARRCRRTASHVGRLLGLLVGDPAVRDAVRDGKISQAQAREINSIKDDPGRANALKYASESGMTANHIRLWREQREVSGISAEIQRVGEMRESLPPPDMRVSMRCSLCSEYHELGTVQVWNVCNKCIDYVSRGVALLQEHEPYDKEQPNGGTRTER
jgi:ParB/RepB/Spo0J family partition protein